MSREVPVGPREYRICNGKDECLAEEGKEMANYWENWDSVTEAKKLFSSVKCYLEVKKDKG